jgi:hypothetical protein
MRFKQLLSTTVAVAALLGAGSSYASSITFDSLGDEATFVYLGSYDGANLCANVTYELTSWSGSSAVFSVEASNCSTGAGSGTNANRLVSFGIGVVNPDLISANVPGIGEWDAVADRNFPGFGTVDLCSYAGPNCSGGAGLGVYVGATDVFNLTLTFASPVSPLSPITFSSPFASKWQSVGTAGRSYEFGGCLAGTPGCGSNNVPEPATVGLLALGLMGLAVVRRRKN